MAPEPAEDRCGNQLRVIQLGMAEDDLHTDQRAGSEAEPHQDFLAAENVSLRLLLAQAEINTRSLLANAGIEAREREASDKLQKLILEELHHRIKNTLATVGAIVSQSLRNLQGAEHAHHAIEGRLLALGRAHDLLLQARWTSADLGTVVRGATEAFDNPDEPKFSISGPDSRMTAGAVMPGPMTLNELCTNIGPNTGQDLGPSFIGYLGGRHPVTSYQVSPVTLVPATIREQRARA